MGISQQQKPFDIADVRTDIETLIQGQYKAPQPEPTGPTDSPTDSPTVAPFEHRPGVDEIGRLSAEGLAQKFEITAKEVEAMGSELAASAKRCDDLMKEVGVALDSVKEAAAQCREFGKLVSLRIEDASLAAAEVKTTCTAMKEKIATPIVVN